MAMALGVEDCHLCSDETDLICDRCKEFACRAHGAPVPVDGQTKWLCDSCIEAW